MTHESSQLEIFIGSPIEYESERITLDRLASSLARARQPSLILANINVGGRQLDFVVARDDLLLVVEAKTSMRPLRGGANGPWQIQGADGAWKNYRNPYLQARDAALALRDAMRAQTDGDVPYPSAVVAFVPSIPPSSAPFAGDFKVRIIGLDGLTTALQGKTQGAWSLALWRDFACRHGLTCVASPELARSRALIEAQDLVAEYSGAFCRTYTPLAEPFIPVECHMDGKPLSSEEVVSLASRHEEDIILRGPSGCGKSLLAIQIGLEVTRRDGVGIILPAKDYRCSLKLLLEQEAALLGAPSAGKLLGAARRLNRRCLLILDGYNECCEQERLALTRRLVAFAQKFEVRLLVTSQIPLVRQDALNLRSVEISPPNEQAKLAIAEKAAGGTALIPEAAALAKAVTSGLEARLVGEVGQTHGLGSSRYALFDAFARKRLGRAASDGIRAASIVAAWLADRIAFSLSVRDFDRLTDAEHISSALCDTLRTAGLLVQRGDRISFAHEMFFHAFAAEAVIRRATGEPTRVLAAMAAPRHDEHLDLIVGAIDDDQLLVHVLGHVTSSKVVASCLSGACGRHAQEWAENRCKEVLARIRDEIFKVAFKIADQSTWSVSFETESLFAWSEQERAVLGVLPDLLFQERYLTPILVIIAAMDARIAEEARRLRNEARERKLRLRSGMFSNTYVSAAEPMPGITHICSRLHSGYCLRRQSIQFVQAVQTKLAADEISNGQLYLLLCLCRQAVSDVICTASLLARIIKRSFASSPYHLQLELMEAASRCGQAEESERSMLVETIEALPKEQHLFISSAILEALQSLGALDVSEVEYSNSVSKELRQCLAEPDRPEAWEAAFYLYFAQFDHPLAAAYCDAISALEDAERRQFLFMAAKGADDSSLFLSPLISELASWGDPKVGAVISRWASLPPPEAVFYQDAMSVFVLAHVSLGLLGCPLPAGKTAASTPSADALRACGEILYWVNRVDLDRKARDAECEHALSVLARHEQGAAADAILHCEEPLIGRLSNLSRKAHIETSLIRCFPDQMSEACRQALRHPGAQAGYFRHFPFRGRDQVLMFAMSVLGDHGTVADLPLLHCYVDDPALAPRVLAAVKKMEGRFSAPESPPTTTCPDHGQALP